MAKKRTMNELRQNKEYYTPSKSIIEEQEAAKVAHEQMLADKESGNQKLKDLGLTDDEIAALTT